MSVILYDAQELADVASLAVLGAPPEARALPNFAPGVIVCLAKFRTRGVRCGVPGSGRKGRAVKIIYLKCEDDSPRYDQAVRAVRLERETAEGRKPRVPAVDVAEVRLEGGHLEDERRGDPPEGSPVASERRGTASQYGLALPGEFPPSTLACGESRGEKG